MEEQEKALTTINSQSFNKFNLDILINEKQSEKSIKALNQALKSSLKQV